MGAKRPNSLVIIDLLYNCISNILSVILKISWFEIMQQFDAFNLVCLVNFMFLVWFSEVFIVFHNIFIISLS